MKVYEIATGYTSVPARMGAATEIVVEALTRTLLRQGTAAEILDMQTDRGETDLPIREIPVPGWLAGTDTSLGLRHKIRRVVYSLFLARELKKLLKDCKEDTVLHFHNQYNLFFFLLLTPRRLRKKALIAYTNHSGIWRLPWPEIRNTIRKRYFQEAACMKYADVVFVLNEETKENAMRYLSISGERITVIGNGVDTEIYCPLPKEKIMDIWGLSGKTVILQAGSVCENKGQIRSLQAAAPLLKADENLLFAYVGGIVSREYHARIRETARQLGVEAQVRYLGTAAPGQEMNRLYNLAAVTVLSSRYEGFPLVAAESLSAGVPVVMSFSMGPGCAENLHDALEHRESLSKTARKMALETLTWASVAKEYTRNWEEALCRKNSTAR